MWTNWAGNQRARPRHILRPASVAQVQEAVQLAAETGSTIRPAGAGHSFTALCACDGVLLDLADLAGIIDVDEGQRRVTAYAGTRICALGAALARHHLALPNQGDIDTQAIAGAVATGTHGTGARFGSFSGQVAAIELVAADGAVHRFAGGEPELRAAALSLGTLGVITRLSLRVVPAYRLRTTTRVMSWPDCLARWEETEAASRNAEFYWLPARDVCVIKAFTLTDDPVTMTPRPPLPPPGTLERYLTPGRVDWSHRAFPSERTVPFVEMEYTLPRAVGLTALTELRELMRSGYPSALWDVEYRTQAGDDRLLSPTRDQPVVTISVHDTPGRASPGLFRDAEALFRSHGGRPHWGKLHTLQSGDLAQLYPGLPAFTRLRHKLDPAGRFLSPYLRDLLT